MTKDCLGQSSAVAMGDGDGETVFRTLEVDGGESPTPR